MDNSDNNLKNLIINIGETLILNSITDAVFIINTDKEILFWNEGAELLTGYSIAEVIGKKCSNFFSSIDENGNDLCLTDNCPTTKCLKHGKLAIEKVYALHKNNRRYPIQGNASPIKDKEGNIIGAIEIIRDVSIEDDYRILQEKFKKLIKQYVSNSTFDHVSRQSVSDYKGKDLIKDITILFVDIVGFSKIAELNPPEEVINLINEIFSIFEVITKEHFGDIDKFIGDAILATFIDANDAVNAAKSILETLPHFNENRKKHGKDTIHLHFGINSGKVIHGEMGTTGRKDLTVIGDAVNIAFEVEKISDPDTIYITLTTYSRLRDAKGFSYLGKRLLKGRQETIDIYSFCY